MQSYWQIKMPCWTRFLVTPAFPRIDVWYLNLVRLRKPWPWGCRSGSLPPLYLSTFVFMDQHIHLAAGFSRTWSCLFFWWKTSQSIQIKAGKAKAPPERTRELRSALSINITGQENKPCWARDWITRQHKSLIWFSLCHESEKNVSLLFLSEGNGLLFNKLVYNFLLIRFVPSW